MLLVFQVRDTSNLIVRDVEDSEIGITLKSRDLGQSVVGDVEFFKVGKG